MSRITKELHSDCMNYANPRAELLIVRNENLKFNLYINEDAITINDDFFHYNKLIFYIIRLNHSNFVCIWIDFCLFSFVVVLISYKTILLFNVFIQISILNRQSYSVAKKYDPYVFFLSPFLNSFNKKKKKTFVIVKNV